LVLHPAPDCPEAERTGHHDADRDTSTVVCRETEAARRAIAADQMQFGQSQRDRETSRAILFHRQPGAGEGNSLMSWDESFFDPISTGGRKPLLTLREAGHYIAGLSKSEQRLAHWQTACETLLLVAESGGDPLLARIAVMRALNHGKPAPAVAPRRKRARAYKVIS
jgi:hypothetical protein